MLFAPPATGAADVARRLANYVVLRNSPAVPLAADDYWQASVPAYERVCGLVARLAEQRPAITSSYLRLVGAPDDYRAHSALASALAELLERESDLCVTAAATVREADREIWIDLWLGSGYSDQEEAHGLGSLLADQEPPSPHAAPLGQQPRGFQAIGGSGPWGSGVSPDDRVPGQQSAPLDQHRVSVIIPFRDRPQGAHPGARTRNLLACLQALRDQDCPPGFARIVVVEADTEPRTEHLIEPLADRYIHAYSGGLFNKSWAVNVGLRDGGEPGRPPAAELTCVLDTDILVERSFLTANAARLGGGHDAHLPYRHMLALDATSTDRAIRRRLGEGAAEVDPEVLRGLLLRDTPGACLWARTATLHAIGGFDERFEGWGGEDDDVTARLAAQGELVRFDDPLLHLDHPRPAMVRENGEYFNAHLLGHNAAATAWTGARDFGDPNRFSPSPVFVRPPETGADQ